eukprot:3148437-Prymnesium_polylepis.1
MSPPDCACSCSECTGLRFMPSPSPSRGAYPKTRFSRTARHTHDNDRGDSAARGKHKTCTIRPQHAQKAQKMPKSSRARRALTFA